MSAKFDAITLEHLKREQKRISAARGAVEALIARNTADRDVVMEKLDLPVHASV